MSWAFALSVSLQVHNEVTALETELENLRAQLEIKVDQLRTLKAEKAEHRSRLGASNSTSGAMVELMRELGQINGEIGKASAKQLDLQEQIDASKLKAVHLEATMAESKEQNREDQATIDQEDARAQQLMTKIEETQAQIDAQEDRMHHINTSHQQLMRGMDGAGGGMYDGQEELAANCGKLETLMAVLPQLEADLAEAEGILRSRNHTLIERTRERSFLQRTLQFLQPAPGQGKHFAGVDPERNFQHLSGEIEAIDKETKRVASEAKQRKQQELFILRQITETETETKRYESSCATLTRKVQERSGMLSELKMKIQEIEMETRTMEHKVELKREQLLRADQIEDW